MLNWKIILAIALPAAFAFVLVVLLLYFYLRGDGFAHKPIEKPRNQIKLLHRVKRDPLDAASKHSGKVASVWRMTYPIKPFDWSEHPALIAEAVEHGWGAFAFTYSCSTCPVTINLWDMCTARSHRQEFEPEISWEMGRGSDYLQKLWLNPGRTPKRENAISLVQALQTVLPVPGPALGPHSFPQDGYFEITILADGRAYNADASQGSFTDNEHVKLISKHFLLGKHQASELTSNYSNEMFDNSSEHPYNLGVEKSSSRAAEKGDHRLSGLEFSRLNTPKNASGHETDPLQVIAIGLAAGGAPPFRLPGSDVGSVGFHSSGQVYLNGVLHAESEPKIPVLKRSWGVVNTTVGCGFNPTAKKVFFTVNGEHAYELTTTSAEYGNPLYPIVAANYDVTLLANFGQSSFEYPPANAYRVADPCFKRPLSRSVKSGFEDSGDLFSMGRIDSQWFTEVASPGSDDIQHRHVLSEAESDLFEIVLDTRS